MVKKATKRHEEIFKSIPVVPVTHMHMPFLPLLPGTVMSASGLLPTSHTNPSFPLSPRSHPGNASPRLDIFPLHPSKPSSRCHRFTPLTPPPPPRCRNRLPPSSTAWPGLLFMHPRRVLRRYSLPPMPPGMSASPITSSRLSCLCLTWPLWRPPRKPSLPSAPNGGWPKAETWRGARGGFASLAVSSAST
ncbi:hypothetical protein Naga_101698g2 [Nannochloropsis gaditana]|uniref:Uncharacterized protein n=1 Tax=Nannochloropsis gaditana TaxID=72520 RepID=W7T9E9_9STRA|nr:hypothetical protein Naga_101698g2 [Nannochloropsis gaditana]